MAMTSQLDFKRREKIMTILFIIFGVLLAMSGFSFLFTPLATFLSYGYFIAILALVYGILGIVNSIKFKKFGIYFVFCIISIIFGIAAIVQPSITIVTDTIMVYATAVWMVLMGIVQIVVSIKVTKQMGSGVWVLQLIFGILAIILGIFAFFAPVVMAGAIGMMIGFFFIETGFTMIFAGIAAKG